MGFDEGGIGMAWWGSATCHGGDLFPEGGGGTRGVRTAVFRGRLGEEALPTGRWEGWTRRVRWVNSTGWRRVGKNAGRGRVFGEWGGGAGEGWGDTMIGGGGESEGGDAGGGEWESGGWS